MSVNIQYKILQCEMPPPPGTWQNIARRLDEEFDVSDARISESLSTITLEPPSESWNQIIAKVPPDSSKIIVFSLNWNRVAVAALAIGLIGSLVLYFAISQNHSSTSEIVDAKLRSPDATKGINPSPVSSEITDFPDLAIAGIIPQATALFHNPKRTSFPLQAFPDNYDESALQPLEIQTIHTVPETEDATVSGPPLRDANGKIIMDMNLLTTQPGNYIVITGPNGEQTRISSKFANFLLYLNQNSPEDEEEYFDFLIRPRDSWKRRFEEWRTKILQQANFSPSCTTLFDILELKELIKD